ncbi:hypothetical protein ACWGBV_01635 [Streptomyces sp. NPDC055051]|uniref:hypothetical protein n=1 Tax=Streptomyces sp. NPDC014861 TaxID=3364923 RepID=UPI0036F8FB47
MFKTKKARITVIAASVVTAAALTSGIALATGIGNPVRAPHAQASGLIKYNGDVDRGTGIAEVTKGGTGIYCIRFVDPKLTAHNITPQTVPVAGVPFGTDAYPAYTRTAQCGDRDDTLTVTVGINGQYADQGFWLLVP